MGTHPIFESDFDCLTDLKMGRKQDADTIQARVKSATNQIKILDQKGVIDIWSIQLWFAALFGSFAFVYICWSVFIVEDEPKSHFPAHMLGLKDPVTNELFVHQSNEPIQVAYVVCDSSTIGATLAAIKSLVLMSIRPVHLVLLTHDTVMNEMLPLVEHFSWSMPGHVTFKFDYARAQLYAAGESYPCAQQKLLLPAELFDQAPGRSSIKVPDARLILASHHWLTLESLDALVKRGPKLKREAMGVFYDNNTQPVDDLIIYDLVKVSEATVYAVCEATISVDGSPWHQYEIWKRAREKHPELGSTGAELKTLYECNREYLARLDFDLGNGKLGLRRAFNRVVFNALSNAFNETNEKLQGFNEAAWAAFDAERGTNDDRRLLTRALDKIGETYLYVLNERKRRLADLNQL